MKQIETTKSGKNYKVINVGKFSDLMDYELPLGPDFTLHGKVFAGQAVGATGSDLSFQTLVPGQDSGFLHTHKTHAHSAQTVTCVAVQTVTSETMFFCAKLC